MRRRVWSGQQMTIGRSSYTQWEREIRWDTKDLLSFFFSLFELTSQVNRLLHYGLIYLFFSLSQLGRREKPKSMTCREICAEEVGSLSPPSPWQVLSTRPLDAISQFARSEIEEEFRKWRQTTYMEGKKKNNFFFLHKTSIASYMYGIVSWLEREREETWLIRRACAPPGCTWQRRRICNFSSCCSSSCEFYSRRERFRARPIDPCGWGDDITDIGRAVEKNTQNHEADSSSR